MEASIVPLLANLGLGGLFFFMWWMERKDKTTLQDLVKNVLDVVQSGKTREQILVDVTNANTKAFTILTERIEHWVERRHHPRNHGDEG